MKLKPALCLDLDGTVRRSKSQPKFIKDENDIEIIDPIGKIISTYKEKGFLILGITNQGGVAHGYKSIDQVTKEIDNTVALLPKNSFDLIVPAYCHEEGTVHPFNVSTLLRKPNYGSLAVCEHYAFVQEATIIDWQNSLFIGDRAEDFGCANNAGIKFMYVEKFLQGGFDVFLENK